MSLKLLIVDDSQVCLVLTRGYVQSFRADWICTLVESAEQAMALIEKQALMLMCWIIICLAVTVWSWLVGSESGISNVLLAC